MDIRPINATNGYVASRPATEATSGVGVQNAAKGFALDFASTLKESETQAIQAMSGDADPHALVQALAQTELAVETAVTIRNRVVEAYQEILRMPV